MNRRIKTMPLVLAAVLIPVLLWLYQPETKNTAHERKSSINQAMSNDAEGFARVLASRPFSFPRDLGPHPDYQTEWWYFTGNLENEEQRRFGYELTLFRYGLSTTPTPSQSGWRSQQLYMAHFALTDVDNKRFFADERFSRAANGLAGAREDRFRIWLYDWTAHSSGNGIFPVNIRAESGEYAIDLMLHSEKPVALQGDNGYSRKNEQPGNASYYFSYTRLHTRGTVTVNGIDYPVNGYSWMDREWSTSALAPEQQGWDWFALQFSDNTELMYYKFRRDDGVPDKNNSGAIFQVDSSKIPLTTADVTIKGTDYWQSPHSGVTYPSRWQFQVPDYRIDVEIIPLLNDQELNLTYRYWEGAVRIQGTKNGKPVAGYGYVELTGYSPES